MAAASDAASPRAGSVDLLRGADVLLMLFVNELAGVSGAPAFLRHAPTAADAMTLADVVFPVFLFVVGLAIPFSLGGRLRRGQPRGAVVLHVLARTTALLVMGVLMANAEQAVAGWLPAPAWNVLATAAVVLVWAIPPAGLGRLRRSWLRAAGIALLVTAALVYRQAGGSGWIELRPLWWGILGLIGWAYLGAGLLYLWSGERARVLVPALLFCYAIAILDAAQAAPWLRGLSPLAGGVVGTHGAVVLSGVLAGIRLRRHVLAGSPRARLALEALGFALALGTAGVLLHALNGWSAAFFWSKNQATAPWGLLSSSLACAGWLLAFLLVDVAGWRSWPRSLTAAAENPLVAYLLAPFLSSLLALSEPVIGGASAYEALAQSPALGLLRSAVFAWCVVRLSGWLGARGLRFRL